MATPPTLNTGLHGSVGNDRLGLGSQGGFSLGFGVAKAYFLVGAGSLPKLGLFCLIVFRGPLVGGKI